ncbi:tetratricopeptide repeat protein [Okeania sp. SIO2B3]|uniref:tetratricopeptide repeat protein n=1 Tax=Okeania sp. SIO2B3 TaxID=2607784 RepID=UPI0013C24A21|nr:tetratricopeptide repeat protein [Okeania sp. SIO2B3]NET45685.1 tetratricopeptide repeat protein [Okeania sp. SIO2B3]
MQENSTNFVSPAQQKTKNVEQGKIYFSLGKVLAKKGEWKEAIAAYRQAIDREQNFADAYHFLGDALVETGGKTEAINVYHKAVEINPELWEVHHKLGNLLQEKEELEEAVFAYHKSLELKSDFCWSYHNLGDVLVKLERWEEAVNAYRRAMELNPDFPWAYYNLGDVLVKLGNWREAIAAYRQAVVRNPQAPWYLYQLGEILRQHSQFEEAVDYLRQAIELKTDAPEFYQSLGAALVKLDRWSEAEEYLNQLIQFPPDSLPTFGGIFLQLGKILVTQGNWNSAIVAYSHAVEFNQSYNLSYHNLGNVLQEKGFLDHALIVYQKAVEFADSPVTLNNLNGKIEQLENQFKRIDNLFLQLSPSQFTSEEITIYAEFTLTPNNGFYSQEYDRNGIPFRWTMAGKPFGFEIFYNHTCAKEIQLRLVNQSINNLTIYCAIDRNVIQLQKELSEDENYAIFTGILSARQAQGQTRIDLIAIHENEQLHLTNNILTLNRQKDRIISVPFSRLSLKNLIPVVS